MRRCLLVCLVTLGCRTPVPTPSKITSVVQLRPAANAEGDQPAEASPAEPALLENDQLVTRLPPVDPQSDDPSPDNSTGIRLVAAYAPQPFESPRAENLPPPIHVPPLSERLKIPKELPVRSAPHSHSLAGT